MIQSISIKSEFTTIDVASKIEQHKLLIDCSSVSEKMNSFDIEIEFSSTIKLFRNHDYTWVDVTKNRIATEFSPKIVQLENGYYVQANQQAGIWEIQKENPNKLLWRFNPENSKPLTKYTGNLNNKVIVGANSDLKFTEQPALLFSKNNGAELSRSEIPFSAIACFTDHCDFDTLENLKAQRNFFKEKNIKTTKGFFLNHFSKRNDNASFENEKKELESWKKHDHELCYHSLSQSIKSEKKSFEDFNNFIPPLSDIPVWIDHGFQPYNFSLFQKNNVNEADYETILKQKNIKILWNYIDSGTATNGVINQINANHFTLSTFLKGNKSLGKIKLAQTMIKNVVFHYLNDDIIIFKYKRTATHFKKIAIQRQFRIVSTFLKDFLSLAKSISVVFFNWSKHKNKPYKLAKYTPIFFKHRIDKEEFVIFQTLEMIDFEKSLSQQNINLLTEEKGVFIAHTYFSDFIAYHNGKLLDSNGKINQNADKNFGYLSEKIKQQKIWNPMLTELYNHLEKFERILFDVDANGSIFVKTSTTIATRKVS